VVYGTGFGTDKFQCYSHADSGIDHLGSPYPVLIFSPAGFSPLSYAAIVEELASHGYIVLGINHTYDAPVSVFPDGRLVTVSPKFMEGVNSQAGHHNDAFHFRAQAADYKAQDMKFVADQMARLTTPPLAGHLDLSRIGAFGHSLGGNAAFELCRTDGRCRAAANMDGANWNVVGKIGVPGKPAMIIAAEHAEYSMPCEALVAGKAFPSTEWCEAERSIVLNGWKKVMETAGPAYMVTIKGAKHVNFADMQFVSLPQDSLFRAVLGSVSPQGMSRLTRDYLLAFFNRHLANIPAPVLDIAPGDYPDVVYDKTATR
jgi:hypothetical protein